MRKNILRVFPRRTSYTPDDALAFVGLPLQDSTLLARHDPPPAESIRAIHVSVTFAWDIERARRLVKAWNWYYSGQVPVLSGGPALRSPCADFSPGMYVKEGITYASRGCNQNCPWCQVCEIEGGHRLIENPAPGWIVADNDFLGCPWPHRLRMYEMLGRQPHAVEFRGGLRANAFTANDAEFISRLRIAKSGLWFACDRPLAIHQLERAAALLAGKFSREKMRCYVLAGFDPAETPDQANDRCRAVYELGFLPFLQLYRAPHETTRRRWPDVWAAVCGRWSRPARSKSYMRTQEAV
jgi:hypothetical protein